MIEKKIRNDKAKNVAKVLKEVIKDPLLTEREIAEMTWVSKSSVNRAMQEVGQIGAKDDRIVNITDKDFELMNIIQEEKFRRLQEEKDRINNTDINKWEETATKRYTLFRWSATWKDWWLKSLSDLSDLELMNMLDGDK